MTQNMWPITEVSTYPRDWVWLEILVVVVRGSSYLLQKKEKASKKSKKLQKNYVIF